MAQGKLKTKAKLPANVKNKKAGNKGPPVSKRANAPIAKKKKFVESHKLKKMITKTVNEKMEKEMRTRAGQGKKSFSQVEQAVAIYNMKNKGQGSSSSSK